MNRIALAKTLYVAAITLIAFQLGRYTVDFNGSGWAWVAATMGCNALAITLYELIRGFWAAPATVPAGGES